VTDELVFSSETFVETVPGVTRLHPRAAGQAHLESRLAEEANRRPEESTFAAYVLATLGSWRVYHFHDTSESAAVKKPGAINDYAYLRGDAGNLAAFLLSLRQRARRHYDLILATIRQVVPFFDDFVLRPLPDNEERIRLEWRERGSDYPFLAHQLSDGTLRFICLSTLLLQPEVPVMILLDEPELGLHPYAITVLAGLIRRAARRTQLVVSTQSVPLVDQFDAEDLLVVERPERATTIRRVDAARLAEWLEAYSLGELWEKNVLGGRP
jgi:predicted ATPase